jgi:hypothetical protein
MQDGSTAVGKSALFFDKNSVSSTTRVFVTKWLGGEDFIVSDFCNPDRFYKTIGWNFTLEKESDQPNQDHLMTVFLSAYENSR